MNHIHVGKRKIGRGCPVYIVAELSANHHHDLAEAVRLVQAAAESGADAVKLQTYTADTMTIDCDRDTFMIHNDSLWEGRRLHNLYDEAHTPWEWFPVLKKVADREGIDLFSTPFDESAVAFLEKQKVPVYKVASFEIVDIPLLEAIGSTGKPVIMSTGMSTEDEIREAVDTLQSKGCKELLLMKCTSAYPAKPDEMNLLGIEKLREVFSVPVGLSDHTLGIEIAVASVALGACAIEKHFALSRDREGPDTAFSLLPSELEELVNKVRSVERALGDAVLGPTQRESEMLAFRRSLFVVEDVSKGDGVTRRNVRCIRPGGGLHPRHYKEVLGNVFSCDVPRGMPLEWGMVR